MTWKLDVSAGLMSRRWSRMAVTSACAAFSAVSDLACTTIWLTEP
jgi:hypothetical protein